MDHYKKDLIEISDKIYDLKEVEFETEQSALIISTYLEEQGFTVNRGVAGLKAAFTATYGSGSPVVAILGEYDALDGIGHACGHNLLGTGSLGAVLKVKEQIGSKGTIMYVGCPAEESGYGKAIMVDKGVFNEIDAALTWHPHYKTEVWSRPSLAVNQTLYHFEGISSHAALAPDKGRSALDAAELMNIGVNYLREHVSDAVRIHYSYINSGGTSPNVVPANTTLNYFVRAPEINELTQVQDRVDDIAKGAALMSGVKLEIVHGSKCSNFVANQKLSERLKEIIEQKQSNDYTTIEAISTDVGDVSHVVPTAQVFIACEPYPFPMHSQEWVDNGKTELAYSGIFKASLVLAELALEIIENNLTKKELL